MTWTWAGIAVATAEKFVEDDAVGGGGMGAVEIFSRAGSSKLRARTTALQDQFGGRHFGRRQGWDRGVASDENPRMPALLFEAQGRKARRYTQLRVVEESWR
jgi:hypothetical protein